MTANQPQAKCQATRPGNGDACWKPAGHDGKHEAWTPTVGWRQSMKRMRKECHRDGAGFAGVPAAV